MVGRNPGQIGTSRVAVLVLRPRCRFSRSRITPVGAGQAGGVGASAPTGVAQGGAGGGGGAGNQTAAAGGGGVGGSYGGGGGGSSRAGLAYDVGGAGGTGVVVIMAW